MPDYTIGIAERIASLPDSFATSNSVNRNYFQETNQSVINKVTVALAPDTPTALDPNPDTEFASSTDGDSVDTYGQQDGPLFITLLATIEEAGELSQYLLRADPAFWFSNLAISLNTLSEANKNIVANLEIGQQIAVTKTFPAGVVPQSVTEYLFVEGISHRVTPESHVVTIYTGPASTFLQWTLSNFLVTTTRINFVKNPSFETDTTEWQTQASTFTRVAGTFGSGAWVAQCVATSATNAGATAEIANVTPGTVLTGSATVLRTAGTKNYFCYFNWFNGASYLSSTFGTVNACATATRLSVTGTAPANTTRCRIYVTTSSNATIGDTHQFDSVLVETGSSALPYFDGTYADPYTGYTLITQGWNGTANASTSTATWGLDSSETGSPLNDSTYGLA
jgi:hypothetical protein